MLNLHLTASNWLFLFFLPLTGPQLGGCILYMIVFLFQFCAQMVLQMLLTESADSRR